MFAVWAIGAIFGISVEFDDLRQRNAPDPEYGSTLAEILSMLASMGLAARGVHINFPERFSLRFPCIAHLRSMHFVVLLACEASQALIFDAKHGLHYVQSDWMFSRFTLNFVQIEQSSPPSPSLWPHILRNLSALKL